jgi:hypothetical protein
VIMLLVLYLVTGLLLVGLSLPLIYRKVPPNYWYGFRVRATLENEEIWYPVNEYAAKRLLWVGIATVVAAAALFSLLTNVGIYASAMGCIVLLGLAVSLIQSLLYLRSLTEVR